MNILLITLSAIVGFIGVLLAPIIAILMVLKVRKQQRINKAVKKEINEGTWSTKFEYQITGKTKTKVDKQIIKAVKKTPKILRKAIIKLYKEIPSQDLDKILKIMEAAMQDQTILTGKK